MTFISAIAETARSVRHRCLAAVLMTALSAVMLLHIDSGLAANKAVPAPPRYYVLDEPRVLSPPALQSLQALLTEHDRLTGEQLVVAIFASLDDEDPVQFTHQVFSQWAIGKRKKDNGALLALYWKEHRIRIEVGYGLEALLTDAKAKGVILDVLTPELKQDSPDRALSLGVLEILRILESPLVQSGQAQEILRRGGFQGGYAPRDQKPTPFSGSLLLLIGVGLALWVIHIITSAESNFSRAGWHRTRPWDTGAWGRRTRRVGGGVFGGGLGGGGGWGNGGGGFLGGCGSSGGGGASGSW